MAQLRFQDYIPEEYRGNLSESCLDKIRRDTEEFKHIYYVETASISSDNYVIDKIEFKADISSDDIIRSVYIDYMNGAVIATIGMKKHKHRDVYTIKFDSTIIITSDVIQIRIQKESNISDMPINISEGKMFFKKKNC